MSFSSESLREMYKKKGFGQNLRGNIVISSDFPGKIFF